MVDDTKQSVPQLRVCLTTLGLPTTGLKADHIARLSTASSTSPAPAPAPAKSTRKRKPAIVISSSSEDDEESEPDEPPVKKTKATKNAEPSKSKIQDEKRPKRFRAAPPQNVRDRMDRCRSQRLFILERTRKDQELKEVFAVAGSTGNVYHVTICEVPVCTCPDSAKNGTCKHILYVMMKALKAPEGLVYQAGLLRSELTTIFNSAPSPASATSSKRKPLDADDCPICYCDFDADGSSAVFCKAQCGTNIHTDCFNQWAETKGADKVTCPICRAPWEASPEENEKLKGVLQRKKKVGKEGYVNVAKELGISRKRDTSTYHRRWGGYGGGWRY